MRKLKLTLCSGLLCRLVAAVLVFSLILPGITVRAAMDASASALSDTQIKLQWTWVPGAESCSIYRNGSAKAIKTFNINTDRDYLSYTDSGLAPETRYTYRLEMRSGSNAILETSEVSAETQQISRPSISSAIFNINRVADKQHKITLQWTNGSASATGAVIKRPDGTQLAALANLSSLTSGGVVTYTFTDTVVEYGQALQYIIVSTDSAEHTSQPSAPISVIPIEPPDISASVQNGTSTVTWTDKTGIDNFQLERSKYGTNSWGSWETLNASITAGAGSVNDTPDSAGLYRYRLAARSSGKYAGVSNISETVLKLAAPSNLICTYAGTDKVNLTWTNGANNEGVIKIEKKIGSGSFSVIATLAKNATSYTDTDSFSATQTYYYRVVAYDSENNKAVSDSATLSTNKPAPPEGLEVAIISNRNLRLSWKDGSNNETSFKIERKTGSGSYSEIASVPANTLQYNDMNVSSGGTYVYRVRANNPSGYSAYTNTVTVTASSTAAPTSLTLKPVSPTQIDLSWTYSGSNTSKTVIERKLPADGTWGEVARVASSVKSYSDKGLKENKQYYYRIRALVDTGVYSIFYPNDSTGKPAYTKLATPGRFTATTKSGSEIYLAWEDNSTESRFIIERKSGSGSYSVVATLQANTKNWTDTNTTLGNTYTYRMKAATDENTSDYSTEETVTASPVTAPSNLAADIDKDGYVELTWKDNSSNESGFEIWRKVESSGTWKKYDTVSKNTRTFLDKKVDKGTRYYYRIRAYMSKDSVVSGFSNEVSITVESLEPPEDLKVEVLSQSRIKLTWEDVSSGETGYRIERKGAEGVYIEIDRIKANSTSYTDSDLQPGTRYYYRVRAYKGSNYSKYSREASATTKSRIAFQDIERVSWAKDAIENMASRGIINGYGEDRFGPEDFMTRAQFVCILVRAFGLEDNSTSKKFDDVKSGQWYYKELMAAKALDIIQADDENNFYPEEPIIREDMAVIISNTLKAIKKPLDSADKKILDDFTDRKSISSNAVQSMANLYGEKIMVGNGDGTIGPKNTTTRAQAAVIIYRILDR